MLLAFELELIKSGMLVLPLLLLLLLCFAIDKEAWSVFLSLDACNASREVVEEEDELEIGSFECVEVFMNVDIFVFLFANVNKNSNLKLN